MSRIASLGLLVGALLVTTSAAAAETWTVLPLRGGSLDAETVETFRELVVSELTGRNGARFVSSPQDCGDAACARDAGAKVGADVAVFGRISQLGRKMIATLTAVDVGGGAVLGTQRMSVTAVEDLEAVAARMAAAIVEGRSVDDTAELGAITQDEQRPDRRRGGHTGPVMRIGGVMPFADGWRAGIGMMADLGYWFEGRDIAIEGRFGYRGTPGADEMESSYHALNVDVLAHYMLGRGDVAPFLGLGGGLRVMEETRVRTTSVGKVVRLTGQVEEHDEAVAGGAVARAGVMLFRTYTTRVVLTLDYDVAFGQLHGVWPQSLQGSIGVVF